MYQLRRVTILVLGLIGLASAITMVIALRGAILAIESVDVAGITTSNKMKLTQVAGEVLGVCAVTIGFLLSMEKNRAALPALSRHMLLIAFNVLVGITWAGIVVVVVASNFSTPPPLMDATVVLCVSYILSMCASSFLLTRGTK
jgi:hypothetical protein